MKNLAKMLLISVVGLAGLVMFLGSVDRSRIGSVVLAEVAPTPTPKPPSVPANTAVNANKPAAPVVNANTPANTGTITTPAPSTSGRTIPKTFTLNTNSATQYGDVAFDHDSHAFMKYSADGNSVMACIECHHTDQAKSELKAPYLTTERDVTMTFDTWKASSQKVNECRYCHFRADDANGRTLPNSSDTDQDNKEAYHKNCNSCHDRALELRPNLKQTAKKGFATSSDCTVCHKAN